MNQVQFNVSIEAFRKSLERGSKIDPVEESGYSNEEEALAKPSFFEHLINWLKNIKPTAVQQNSSTLKNKVV